MAGYIKLYRDLLNNPVVCKDADHLAVWVYLLLEASHKETSVMFGGKRVWLDPGQFTTGRMRIAKRLGISGSKVQRILKLFEDENQIEQRTDRQSRLISILNWAEYQMSEQRVNNGFDTSKPKRQKNTQKLNNEMNNGFAPGSDGFSTDLTSFSHYGEQRNEQRVDNEWTTSEQRVNTKQEYKEVKEGKNIYRDLPEPIKEPFEAYLEMRKKIKKPMTDRAIKMLLTELGKLTSDEQTAVKIIEQATVKCWLSFYPLKDDKRVNFMEVDV